MEKLRVSVALAVVCSVGCQDSRSPLPEQTPSTSRPVVQSSAAQVSLRDRVEIAPNQRLKIIVSGTAVSMISELRELAPNATFLKTDSQKLVAQMADADAAIGVEMSPQLVKASTNLKWVQAYSAGVERFRFPELVNSDVVLTNAKIIQGPTVADHALALLLALTRNLVRLIPNKAQQNWNVPDYTATDLYEKTAIVIGVGGIGTQIAQRAHAFGMKVIGIDLRDTPMSDIVPRTFFPDRLDDVLPVADVVFVAVPETPQSAHMISTKQFGLMKRKPYFIAVSRGPVYDLAALQTALQEGRLAGAGLDVTDPEPLPSNHPLWKFSNVLITPHVAWVTDNDSRLRELVRDNVERFAKGQRLRNVVDKRAGY